MLKVKGRTKEYQVKANQMKSEVTIFISDKVEFIPKNLKRDKKKSFIMLKATICNAYVIYTNIYT